jgi:hypothetical protein
MDWSSSSCRCPCHDLCPASEGGCRLLCDRLGLGGAFGSCGLRRGRLLFRLEGSFARTSLLLGRHLAPPRVLASVPRQTSSAYVARTSSSRATRSTNSRLVLLAALRILRLDDATTFCRTRVTGPSLHSRTGRTNALIFEGVARTAACALRCRADQLVADAPSGFGDPGRGRLPCGKSARARGLSERMESGSPTLAAVPSIPVCRPDQIARTASKNLHYAVRRFEHFGLPPDCIAPACTNCWAQEPEHKPDCMISTNGSPSGRQAAPPNAHDDESEALRCL